MLMSGFVRETKKAAGISADSDLAKLLGATRQAVNLWSNDLRLPDATHAGLMAAMQGREPLAGVAAVELERHRDNPIAVRFWQAELRKVREFIFRCLDTCAQKSQAQAVQHFCNTGIYYSAF